MSSFNEEIHDLKERNADLNDELEYWKIAAGNWRSRAEELEACLESAVAGLRVIQERLTEQDSQIEKLRRLLGDSQVLLGHALGAVEE